MTSVHLDNIKLTIYNVQDMRMMFDDDAPNKIGDAEVDRSQGAARAISVRLHWLHVSHP